MKIDGISSSETYALQAETHKESESTDAFKTALEKAAQSGDMDQLKEACTQFESYFINTLFKQMRSSGTIGAVEDKSQAREYFEGMLDEELSKEMTKSGGVGIADMLFDNLKKAYASTDDKGKDESEKDYEPLDLKG